MKPLHATTAATLALAALAFPTAAYAADNANVEETLEHGPRVYVVEAGDTLSYAATDEQTDPAPIDPDPIDPTPITPDPAPTPTPDPVPVEPAPIDPTPIDPLPVEPTPPAPEPESTPEPAPAPNFEQVDTNPGEYVEHSYTAGNSEYSGYVTARPARALANTGAHTAPMLASSALLAAAGIAVKVRQHKPSLYQPKH